MKLMAGLAAMVAVTLLGTGCATKGHVKEQIDPLSERIGKLEQAQADSSSKLDSLGQKVDAAGTDSQALRGEIADSAAQAQQAQQSASDAQAAADRAEQAASRAETAADRATKAFELRQKRPK